MKVSHRWDDVMASPEYVAFVEALAEDPADGLVANVFADWLDERGVPGAGAFLRDRAAGYLTMLTQRDGVPAPVWQLVDDLNAAVVKGRRRQSVG